MNLVRYACYYFLTQRRSDILKRFRPSHLDVTFKEDDCRCSIGNSAQNFAMLRQFALNLIRQEPTKKSVDRKQKLAGWVDEFLLEILLGGPKLGEI